MLPHVESYSVLLSLFFLSIAFQKSELRNFVLPFLNPDYRDFLPYVARGSLEAIV
jgi:hypothetical protein